MCPCFILKLSERGSPIKLIVVLIQMVISTYVARNTESSTWFVAIVTTVVTRL